MSKSLINKGLSSSKGYSFIMTIIIFLFLPAGQKDPPTQVEGDNRKIIDINHLSYKIANQHDQFYSFIGVRALTLVHLAIHDIYNNRERRYKPYLITEKNVKDFDVPAAIISSTQYLLNEIYSARKDTIDQICNQWLSQLTPSTPKDEGINFGKIVAKKYLEYRDHDGHEKNGDYTPMTKPGDYQYTPGFDYVWKPDFSVARPFTLDSVSQFRCPPPPSLDSKEYAESYNEVKSFGAKNSAARTEDQTSFGHWWAEFGEHGWNRIGRIVAEKEKLSAVETNRIFALINMNLYDLYLASFDSKYFYDTWRPYTAIHQGDGDGNPATSGDPKWEPEMVTPPWPEYPSAHAAVGASGAEIISEILGTPKVSFTMQSTTALPSHPERTYNNLDQAANDCADSRIMNGYHFRFATEEGKRQGRVIARHTVANFLTPLQRKN